MFEEKKTDVNIACQILNDTYLDRYDLCYLVSGDSDLAPPLQIVKENHSDKRVLVVHPPRRKSVELCGIADGWFAIGEQKLKALYGFGTANVAANREKRKNDESRKSARIHSRGFARFVVFSSAS